MLSEAEYYPPKAQAEERRLKSAPFHNMIDIRKQPQTIEAINAALNAKNIAEVKAEPKGIAVVEIKRQVKSIEKAE